MGCFGVKRHSDCEIKLVLLSKRTPRTTRDSSHGPLPPAAHCPVRCSPYTPAPAPAVSAAEPKYSSVDSRGAPRQHPHTEKVSNDNIIITHTHIYIVKVNAMTRVMHKTVSATAWEWFEKQRERGKQRQGQLTQKE